MPEEKKAQEQLEESNEDIRKQAYAEVDGVEEETQELPEKEEENEEDEFSFGDEDDSTEDLEKEPEEESEQEPEEQEEEETTETEDSKKEPEVTDVNLEELAEKYGVSKEDAESILKQQKHYKNDPNELAKALLNSQRGYSKLEKDFNALKEQSSQPEQREYSKNDVKQIILNKQYQIDGRFYSKDDIITEYCRVNSNLTEDLDDDKVFELACREIADLTNKDLRNKQASLPSDARAKRSEIKDSLKDEVPKEYMTEIKETIDNLGDREIMNPQFDVEFLANWIKGGHYSEDIKKVKKEAYEQGLKDGREKASIITPPVGGSNGASTKKASSGNVIKFDDEQNDRMDAMFKSTKMSEQERKVNYMLYYPEQFSDKQIAWAKKQEKKFGG